MTTLSIRCNPANRARFAARNLNIGLNGIMYWAGYSRTLDWTKTIMGPPACVVSGSDVEFSQATVDAGYFQANGKLTVPAAAGVTALKSGLVVPSFNPTEDFTGEAMTLTYTGSCTGVGWLSVTDVQHFPAEKKVTFKLAQSSCNISLNFTDLNDPPVITGIYQDRYENDVTIDGITYLGWSNAGEWNPDWLHEISHGGVIRFMDLMNTNYSPIVNWSETADEGYAIWGIDKAGYPKGGFPVSALCRLAIATGAKPWFCIPHKASDDYVTQLATTVKAALAGTGIVAMFEYSNEVWNDSFGGSTGQSSWVSSKATEWGVADLWQATGYRASQCMKIIKDVFNDDSRWEGVLGTQTVRPVVTTGMIDGFSAWKTATGYAGAVNSLFKSLALTGYFGEVLSSPQIQNLVRGTQTVITLPAGFGPFFPQGSEIVIGLRKNLDGVSNPHDPGIPEISLNPEGTVKYHTVVDQTGDVITLNTDSSAMSAWNNTGESYVVDSKYFRLADESERLHNIGSKPTKYTYFNEQFAQLCRTGTCSFGITMSEAYTLAGFDTNPGFWVQQKAIVDANGLHLDQYEAGTHFITTALLGGYVHVSVTVKEGVNPVGDRFFEFQTNVQHSPEFAEVYSDMYRRFIAIGGRYPAKFVEGGRGLWGGIRSWIPNVDRDNPVWKATRAGSRAFFAP